MAKGKRCFIIAAFGEPDSRERKRFKGIEALILNPVLKANGYSVGHALNDSRSGRIPDLIVQRLLEANLVIADLTGLNPNVFYELGIRHALEKSTILIMDKFGSVPPDLPFDVNNEKVVFLPRADDREGTAETIEQLKDQIRELDRDPNFYSSPVARAFTVMGVERIARESPSTAEAAVAKGQVEILSALDGVKASLEQLRENQGRSTQFSAGTSLDTQAQILFQCIQKSSEELKDFNIRVFSEGLTGLDPAWLANMKLEVLKDVCELLKLDRSYYGGPGDYFKATLFTVEDADFLSLDNCFYPPGMGPNTREIRRDKRKATAFHCMDNKAMIVISDVPAEARKPNGRWVELWPGQSQGYGSMVCVPVTLGDHSNGSHFVKSILTINTNRVGFFSEDDQQKNFIATVFAPFRRMLSLTYTFGDLTLHSAGS